MQLFIKRSTSCNSLPRELLVACTTSLNTRRFSILNRPPPKYEGHVPLTGIERAGLAVGSAVMSLFDPHRGGIFQTFIAPYSLLIASQTSSQL